MLNKKSVEDEKHLRVMIKKCMNKEFNGSTNQNVTSLINYYPRCVCKWNDL